MRCEYCGRKLQRGERCRCRIRSRRDAQRNQREAYESRDPRRNQNSYKKRKRRNPFPIIFAVILVMALLAAASFIGYEVLVKKTDVMQWIPFLKEKTVDVGGQEMPKIDTSLPPQTERRTEMEGTDHTEELAQLQSLYIEGRIDYGGVKKGLNRIDAASLGENERSVYDSLNTQAEQELKDKIAGYVNSGNESEAYALLSRMSMTVPGDALTAELVAQYGF